MIKLFERMGLDDFQSQILEFLIKNGSSKPSYVSNILNIARPTVYKALYELEDMSLIKRIVTSNIDEDLRFEAKSPYFIKQLLTKKRLKLEKLEEEFDSEYPEIIEFFLNKSKDPVIDVYYGVEGLKKIHLLIESKKLPVQVIRSINDRETEGLKKEIDRHVSQRGKLGIPTKIITPEIDTLKDTKKQFPIVEGREIKVVSAQLLSIPSQVMLFDNKAALTNFDDKLITLLISQKSIYDSFSTIFDMLWKYPTIKKF